MPKALKPVEADTVRHDKADVTVTIFFNRNNQKFFATVAGKVLENETCAALRGEVWTAIEEATKVEWIPVIEIEKLAPFHAQEYTGFIGFTVDRYYVAQLASGRMLKSRWYEPGEDGEEGESGVARPLAEYRAEQEAKGRRPYSKFSFAESFYWNKEERGKFRLPYPYDGFKVKRGYGTHPGEITEEKEFYVRYTPELWQALNALQAKIEDARRRLDELLLTSDGHAMLEAWVTQKALPPAVNLLSEQETTADALKGTDSKQAPSRRRKSR